MCAPGARSPWPYEYLCINPTYPLPELEFFAHLYLYARDREDTLVRVAAPQPWDQRLGPHVLAREALLRGQAAGCLSVCGGDVLRGSPGCRGRSLRDAQYEPLTVVHSGRRGTTMASTGGLHYQETAAGPGGGGAQVGAGVNRRQSSCLSDASSRMTRLFPRGIIRAQGRTRAA